MTPTQCTLNRLRKEGYSAGVVEKWIAQIKIRKDLYGFIDIVAIRENNQGVFAVQATSKSNISSRVIKALEIKELKIWLLAGNRFEVWGWANKKKGSRYTVSKRLFILENDNIIVNKILQEEENAAE